MKSLPFDAIGVGLLIVFSLVIISGLYIPVYSDEAITKWPFMEIIGNDWRLFSFFPQCDFSSAKNLPLAFYPAAILLELAYGGLGPLGLRISGVIIGLCCIFGLYSVLKAKILVGSGIGTMGAFILPMVILSLGVMPYLLVIARSEQLLVIYILIVCLLCFYKQKEGGLFYYLSIGTFITATLCILLVHSKALFLLPLSVFVAIHLTRGRSRYHRLAVVFFITYLFYLAYDIAVYFSTCPAAPKIRATLHQNTIPIELLISSPSDFFAQGIGSLYEAPDKITSHIIFQSTYQSNWLPALESISDIQVLINYIIKIIVTALLIVGAIWPLIYFLYGFWKRNLSVERWLALMISLTTLSTAFFFRSWNFYSASFFIPVSILSCLLTIRIDKIKRFIFIVLLPVSLASLVSLVLSQFPLLVKNSHTLYAGIPGQQLSIPTFSADKHIINIKKVESMCGVTVDGSKHFILDHMTRYAFKNLNSPIHALYISEKAYGADLLDGRLLPFLKRIESPGAITQCNYLPSQLRPTVEFEGYCCIDLQR